MDTTYSISRWTPIKGICMTNLISINQFIELILVGIQNVSILQVGSGSLYLYYVDDYAVFGPFENLCFTSPDVCTDGFTVTFWMAMLSGRNRYILSNRDDSGSEGLTVRCQSDGVKIDIKSGGSTETRLVLVSQCKYVSHVFF